MLPAGGAEGRRPPLTPTAPLAKRDFPPIQKALQEKKKFSQEIPLGVQENTVWGKNWEMLLSPGYTGALVP